MKKSLLRTSEEIEEIYNRNVETVYRVCFTYMKNSTDTEDMVQNTFLKLISYNKKFNCAEHEKAWLIVTASNLCKDYFKSKWSKVKNIDDYENILTEKSDFNIDETLKVIIELPLKYKTVIYMYYYEGYNSNEIAKILNKPKSTVRVYLHKGRKILKSKLGGDFYEK